MLMIPGNLADQYKENGMRFEELEVSGDVPLPLYGQGIVMDGKYIYSIGGGTSDHRCEMDVHRFDLITRKWEQSHKSLRAGEEPEPRYPHDVVFYKGRIFIFGGMAGDIDEDIIQYGFLVTVKYLIYMLNMVLSTYLRFIQSYSLFYG